MDAVVSAVTNFTNITLSSLYFDITKDVLYADAINSVARRSVITVLQQVCTSTTVEEIEIDSYNK
jgi:isoleucyl-tRNA synthetase